MTRILTMKILMGRGEQDERVFVKMAWIKVEVVKRDEKHFVCGLDVDCI